jgi:hypothetical protein
MFSSTNACAVHAVLPVRSEGNSSGRRSRTKGAEEGEHAAQGGALGAAVATRGGER